MVSFLSFCYPRAPSHLPRSETSNPQTFGADVSPLSENEPHTVSTDSFRPFNTSEWPPSVVQPMSLFYTDDNLQIDVNDLISQITDGTVDERFLTDCDKVVNIITQLDDPDTGMLLDLFEKCNNDNIRFSDDDSRRSFKLVTDALENKLAHHWRKNDAILELIKKGKIKNLQGVVLSSADLSGADLSGADLSDAILILTILSHANLENADLRYVVLSDEDVLRAILSGVNLGHAILIRENLRNADL